MTSYGTQVTAALAVRRWTIGSSHALFSPISVGCQVYHVLPTELHNTEWNSSFVFTTVCPNVEWLYIPYSGNQLQHSNPLTIPCFIISVASTSDIRLSFITRWQSNHLVRGLFSTRPIHHPQFLPVLYNLNYFKDIWFGNGSPWPRTAWFFMYMFVLPPPWLTADTCYAWNAWLLGSGRCLLTLLTWTQSPAIIPFTGFSSFLLLPVWMMNAIHISLTK